MGPYWAGEWGIPWISLKGQPCYTDGLAKKSIRYWQPACIFQAFSSKRKGMELDHNAICFYVLPKPLDLGVVDGGQPEMWKTGKGMELTAQQSRGQK